MKLFNVLTIAAAGMVTLACCTKESAGVAEQGNLVTVSVEAGLMSNATKALNDNDGHASQINHWVMEVLDSEGNVYTRQERDSVAAGTLSQSFTVTLFKNNTYDILFWADTKGAYSTDTLTNVKVADLVANKDSRDAFSTSVKGYKSTGSEQISATLTRPFAQLNVQTTDLQTLWETVDTVAAEYLSYAPSDFKLIISAPQTFNVKTQTAGAAVSDTLTASASYTGYQTDSVTFKTKDNYAAHLADATLFSDYIFAAGEKALFDVSFSFKTKGNVVDYTFTSVPLQRNYRTNIKGNLLSANAVWNVTIDPDWSTPDYDHSIE